jgi:tetratricopeptide (TPR) repeat protein
MRQAQSAEAALSLGGGDDQITRSALGSLASAEFSLNGAPAGLAVLEKRLPERPGDVAGADGELLAVRGLLRLYAAQTRSGIVDLRAAIRLSRAGFSQQHLPAAHVYLARALYVVGDWDEALVHARAAQAIVSDDRLSWIRGRAESVIGTVAAARGSWEEAEACLAIANDAASAASDAAWPDLVARLVRSAICRARADAAGVVDALRPLMTDKRVVVSQMAVVAWWPILVEGLIDSGELREAATELDRLQRHIDDTRMDIGGQVAGQRARLAAANGDPDEAAAQFQLAIENDQTRRSAGRSRTVAAPLWSSVARAGESSRRRRPSARRARSVRRGGCRAVSAGGRRRPGVVRNPDGDKAFAVDLNRA